jgi:hypothetical protein
MANGKWRWWQWWWYLQWQRFGAFSIQYHVAVLRVALIRRLHGRLFVHGAKERPPWLQRGCCGWWLVADDWVRDCFVFIFLGSWQLAGPGFLFRCNT